MALRSGVARFKCARELSIKDGSKEHNLTDRWTDPSVKKHVQQAATAFQSSWAVEDKYPQISSNILNLENRHHFIRISH